MTILGRLSPGDDGLSDIPELTIAAVEAARWNPGVGCLIDRVYPGLPLVLAFGYARYDTLPNFDFFSRRRSSRIGSAADSTRSWCATSRTCGIIAASPGWVRTRTRSRGACVR
jgi:hypothetical protein